jgi:hypothetical protein
LLSIAPSVLADTPPALRDLDRIRLAEAFRLADAIGNRLWADWDKATFAVLLVTPDHEFLIRHPKPTDDFTSLGEDAMLKQKVFVRKRTYATDLLATFPAVGGVPTIVIGQAENTAAKTSTRWVITLLHEHFHQLQMSQPKYFADVDALGLARGDKTGMWMLNFDFPYSKPEVEERHAALGKALGEAVEARKDKDFAKKRAAYLEARKKFQAALKEDDYKYASFQIWNEGIARYTEYRVAEWAAGEYQPSKAFQELKDYTSFKDEARTILDGIQKELATFNLSKAKRAVFYPLGAAEGLILDELKPEWRKRYWEQKFSLDKVVLEEK